MASRSDKAGRSLESWGRSLHQGHLLLVLGSPETAEEATSVLGITGSVKGGTLSTAWQRLAGLGVDLGRLGACWRSLTMSHGTVTIQEVRVASVHVASFHVDQVLDQLVGGLHGLLEEGDHHSVELLLQHGVAAEQLLGQELTQRCGQARQRPGRYT